MPGGNKTGPEGIGSMTGRRMGYCVNNEHPGWDYQNSRRSEGFRRGRGGVGFRRGGGQGFQHRHRMGFSFGNRNFSNYSMENVSEKTLIENDIRILKDQLSGLEDQLGKLDNE